MFVTNLSTNHIKSDLICAISQTMEPVEGISNGNAALSNSGIIVVLSDLKFVVVLFYIYWKSLIYAFRRKKNSCFTTVFMII